MTLFLVSTPIGNLKDISFRALDILRASTLILCEDTRRSQILLHHHEIRKPLKSYHQFSEAKKEEGIISRLLEGEQISLISDAGTPGIADPGERLVKRCIKEGIRVEAIPGPCALIQALVCSGLPTSTFQFIGFLPKKKGELTTSLLSILDYPGTTICYESPKRLLILLKKLSELAPNREVVIARELTKKFEEYKRGSLKELFELMQDKELKGEIVLLLKGTETPDWSHLSLKEHVHFLKQQFSLSEKEAIKLVAFLRKVPSREIYRTVKNLS